MPSPSTEAIDREIVLLERRKHVLRARRSLSEFGTYINPAIRPARMHLKICSLLHRVEAGECDRAMIFAPPGHGKSEWVSRFFPAWYMGRNPRRNVISTSYGGDLATGIGADVRRIVQYPEYQEVWPGIRLSPDEQAKDRWQIEYTDPAGRVRVGGRYHAAGVSGAVVGRRAHLILIDDPVKGSDEADSLIERNRAYRWSLGDLLGRAHMDGLAIVIIQTRWHIDDLSGRLLRDMANGADQWEILEIQDRRDADNLADPLGREVGEACWPEAYPVERLERLERAMTISEGPRAYRAQYRQRPPAAGGTLIRRERVEAHMYQWGQHPPGMNVLLTSDYAVTAGKGNFTVHMAWGLDGRHHLWLLDVWRRQGDTLEWCLAWLDMCRRWEPSYALEEVGQIQKSVGPFLTRLMREHEVYVARSSEDRKYVPTASKAARARSITGRLQMGMVHVARDAPWTGALIDELLSVTGEGDEADDQLDNFSLIGLHLASMEGDEEGPGEVKARKDYGSVGNWREDAKRRARKAVVGREAGSLGAYVVENGLSSGGRPRADEDDDEDDMEDDDE